jgi:molybdopterin molybdotransferase
MPKGTDTVVIQENTEREGDEVVVTRATETGRNVRREGLDFRRGDMLLTKGTRLNERGLMLAAAMNYATVPIIRPPRVAILGTGDELILPGSEPGPGEIVYSNGYALAALARQEGADVLDLGIARDRIEDIASAIRRAQEAKADVLLTSGGASVGDHDLVQRALKAEGFALSFWRIAMRPGRPMMHATRNAMQVLGVPGNPVSSYVCAFLFLVPLLRKLGGRSDLEHCVLAAKLGRDLPANDERADYLRASLEERANGTLVATPLQQQDSSMMLNLARADCLVIREPHAAAAIAGSPCVILKLRL